ncbi:MAG TPA: hypothetical protein PKY29_10430 [Ferruginibacter sp.]|nr:hypothetical protein [Ferruginibacter sp.]HRO18493.1 hypothetical protein [Ferruginibacter sp.]HRQ21724.1 hypothetical protein [Ferruginibacter sp.]
MQLIQLIILFHAATGGIALLSGLGAILFKKGSIHHKRSGRLFYFAMLISASVALVIAVLPGHENSFLFSIGLFSLYFLLIGKRAIGYKKVNHAFKTDVLISYGMLICSASIPVVPWLSGKNIHIVPVIFGLFGIGMAIGNILRFKKTETVKKRWLSFHIGHIMGGYISAVTAFVVVNQFLPPDIAWLAWIAPGLFGGLYISYWIRKTRPKIRKS